MGYEISAGKLKGIDNVWLFYLMKIVVVMYLMMDLKMGKNKGKSNIFS